MVEKRCKDCDQPVKWVKTKAGRWIPLIPSPDPRGTFVLQPVINEQGGQEMRAVGLTSQERDLAHSQGQFLWASHASACTAIPKPAPKGCPPHLRDQLFRKKNRR